MPAGLGVLAAPPDGRDRAAQIPAPKFPAPQPGSALSASSPLAGGPRYRFAVRPQQIVTVRFGAASAVAVPEPIKQWDALVPAEKLPALHEYSTLKGHPGDVK